MLQAIECREVADLAGDYVEEALPPERQRLIEAHLHECESCRGGMEACVRILGMFRSTGGRRMPPDMKKRLMAAFRTYAASRRN